MKLKALRNNIIIEEIAVKEETKGGLIIANAARSATMKGKILSVGPGIVDGDGKKDGTPFAEGQTVLFSKGTGQSITYEGTKYVFFKPEDILAILK